MKFTTSVAFLLPVLLCATTAHADSFGTGANQFDIDFILIGNAHNADDTTGTPSPIGKVEYEYGIGEFEVSEDMINKANALGSLGITHDNRGVNKPATSISWVEAAKFVNWLNDQAGASHAYKFSGTTFALWQPSDPGYQASNPFRNSDALYVLPSADEWYKAAYYDPVAEVYYDYATGSNATPDGMDFTGDTVFDIVFFDGGSNTQPNDVMDVGVSSPYSTFGQDGNVFEWEETETDLVNDSALAAHGTRGGSWDDDSTLVGTSFRGSGFPTAEVFFIGFRVAKIPEPSSLLLLTLAICGALAWRRRESHPDV